jgi:hypothetical protein
MASHQLAVSVGKALRREGLATGHIQVLTSRGPGAPRLVPITNGRHPFHVACKSLADATPPSHRNAASSRAGRRQLRETLDTVTLSRSEPLRRMPRLTASVPRRLPR